MHPLKFFYNKIGIHTAPPDTILGLIHSILFKLFGKPKPPQFPLQRFRGKHWYHVIDIAGDEFYRHPDTPHFQECLVPSEEVVFDVHHAVEKYKIRSIGLIFFMGIGDYLFATPFLRQLRAELPAHSIVAFVSKSHDMNSNPLVADLLTADPNVDEVRLFDGQRGKDSLTDWRNYDYKAVTTSVGGDVLTLPMIYEYDLSIRNRADSLCKSFGLQKPESNHPIIPRLPLPSGEAAQLLQAISDAFVKCQANAVIFLQLENRSSNYLYPHVKELCRRLMSLGCIVVNVANGCEEIRDDAMYFEIDIKRFSILQSMTILASLKASFEDKLSMITVPSVFGAVSSGMGIRSVQLQHRFDVGLAGILYSNIMVLTNKDYASIPESHLILADRSEYTQDYRGFASYDVEAVVRAWRRASNPNADIAIRLAISSKRRSFIP